MIDSMSLILRVDVFFFSLSSMDVRFWAYVGSNGLLSTVVPTILVISSKAELARVFVEQWRCVSKK